MLDGPTALAVAGVVVAIAIELAWGARAGRLGYTLSDSIDSVVIGAIAFGLGTIMVLQGVAIHRFLDGYAVVTLPTDAVATWVFVMVATDLGFYVSHRAMHRVNLLWTVHAVHHQSEQYNLLVALRIGWGSVFVSWIFYLPLALVGVTLPMTVAARGLSSLYQFVLHTRWVGRLGGLERVLVTPSHHRVHHGRDAAYLDRNYGGILIVWDRWFGTFAAEGAEPRYGTVRPLARRDPLWANLVEWVRLARLTARVPRWRDKLALWFHPPGWAPRG